MSVYEPVRAARLAWMRQQHQLFIEVDDLAKFEESCRVAPTHVGLPCATANTRDSSIHIDVGTIAKRVPGTPLTEEGTGLLVVEATVAREGRPTSNTHNEGRSGSPVRESTAAATGG